MDTNISAASSVQPFQVVLLAGGKGQKLFPLADHYPKPLLPIANKPLIAFQLENLERMGFYEVLVVIRHSKTLEKYLKTEFKGKMQIETIEINEESTNNVEALKQIWNKINRDFIIIPCDLLTDVNLDDVLDQHIITQATVTMVFREDESKKQQISSKKEASKEPKEELNDYDVVVLDDESHRVLQITNNIDIESEGLNIKKTMLLRHPNSTISTQLNECHLYVFNYRMIDFLKRCKRKFLNLKEDLIPFLIQNQYNKKLDREFFFEEYQALDEAKDKNLNLDDFKQGHVSVFGFILKNTYCKRINMINQYIQGNLDVFLKPPPLCLNPTKNNELESKEKKPSDTIIGEGTTIDEKCLISRSVIGKNCVIGSNVKITKSVIMNNVVIENDCVIQDSVICSKAVIREKVKIKEDTVGHNETINP